MKMVSDWETVKRLAADFQKVQQTYTLNKLSERNCIEIVTLLVEKQLLEVVFTNDGKEYITPEYLEKEIHDELYINNGRINLIEISKSLNVDLTKIEHIADKITQENNQIYLILGQLIDENYLTYLAEDINEKLVEHGQIYINSLSEHFDLPSEFILRNVVEKQLGKLIKGRQDPTNPHIIFTQAYIQRCKGKMRGALAALTQPTNVSTILQQINIQQRLFNTLIDEININGHITSKQANAEYIPNIYTKMQSNWIHNFYEQNGFLEYDAVHKLGITNAKQYIQKQFADKELIYLKRCVVSEKLIEFTVIPALTAAKQFIDLAGLLPINMTTNDKKELLEVIINNKMNTTNYNGNNKFVLISNDLHSIAFTTDYLKELSEPCRNLAHIKARCAIESGAYQQYIASKQLLHKTTDASKDENIKMDKKDERRKKATSGKAGGGSQGRETKTKSTKKCARANVRKLSDSDDEETVHQYDNRINKRQFELLSMYDIIEVFENQIKTVGLEYLSNDLAAMYYEELNDLGLRYAQELYELTLQRNNSTDTGQTHVAVQEKINALLTDFRLYEKGLKLFAGDVQNSLTKYLLKSLGNDVCNELIIYVARECGLEIKSIQMNPDQRNKLAQKCGQYKSSLIELDKTLNKSTEDFFIATELLMNQCSMIIKKIDKKKDRLLIAQHKQQLLKQLEKETEPAIILHLTVLILFTAITGCILHASGKFVMQILNYIKPSLDNEQCHLLCTYHDLVINTLRVTNQSEEYNTAMNNLQDIQFPIKSLAHNFVKRTSSKSE